MLSQLSKSLEAKHKDDALQFPELYAAYLRTQDGANRSLFSASRGKRLPPPPNPGFQQSPPTPTHQKSGIWGCCWGGGGGGFRMDWTSLFLPYTQQQRAERSTYAHFNRSEICYSFQNNNFRLWVTTHKYYE
jgi:hypothetical protein